MDLKLLFALFTFVVFQACLTETLASKDVTKLDLEALLEVYQKIITGYYVPPVTTNLENAKQIGTNDTSCSPGLGNIYVAVTYAFEEFSVTPELIEDKLHLSRTPHVVTLRLAETFRGNLIVTMVDSQNRMTSVYIYFGVSGLTTTLSLNGKDVATEVMLEFFTVKRPKEEEPLRIPLKMLFIKLLGEEISKRLESFRDQFMKASCSA